MSAQQKLENAYRRAAQRLLYDEGELEIDDTAPVSAYDRDQLRNEGAYVQAWVWIAHDDLKPEDVRK